jgi:hypothetical protein
MHLCNSRLSRHTEAGCARATIVQRGVNMSHNSVLCRTFWGYIMRTYRTSESVVSQSPTDKGVSMELDEYPWLVAAN